MTLWNARDASNDHLYAIRNRHTVKSGLGLNDIFPGHRDYVPDSARAAVEGAHEDDNDSDYIDESCELEAEVALLCPCWLGETASAIAAKIEAAYSGGSSDMECSDIHTDSGQSLGRIFDRSKDAQRYDETGIEALAGYAHASDTLLTCRYMLAGARVGYYVVPQLTLAVANACHPELEAISRLVGFCEDTSPSVY